MTTKNPTPGNETGLPATEVTLDKYLTDMQARACRLSGIIAAIACLEDNGTCKQGQAALIFMAEELASDLYNALDCTRIPNGEVS